MDDPIELCKSMWTFFLYVIFDCELQIICRYLNFYRLISKYGMAGGKNGGVCSCLSMSSYFVKKSNKRQNMIFSNTNIQSRYVFHNVIKIRNGQGFVFFLMHSTNRRMPADQHPIFVLLGQHCICFPVNFTNFFSKNFYNLPRYKCF